MRQGIDSLPDCGTTNNSIAPQLPKHLCFRAFTHSLQSFAKNPKILHKTTEFRLIRIQERKFDRTESYLKVRVAKIPIEHPKSQRGMGNRVFRPAVNLWVRSNLLISEGASTMFGDFLMLLHIYAKALRMFCVNLGILSRSNLLRFIQKSHRP
ncbi:MAG: hypothetical protein HC849_20310 [Oscillatoriales cyanobacterium RU_3_3]|nr:hypothetical protein [Oscillatoriales cyanobacterium RU_3_3]